MPGTGYELYSCPFCAADVKKAHKNWLTYDQDRNFSVTCVCGARGPKRESKEKAIMAWNRRAGSAVNASWKPFDLHEEKAGLKGELTSIDFASILQLLSTVNKTGVLQVHQGQKKSAICLKDGQVIAASRNYGPQLGEILFDNNLISLKKLEKALKKSKTSGKHLGGVLLDLGYLDQKTLRRLIRQQVSETIQELMQWEGGAFHYRDYAIEFDKRVVEDISIMGLMLDSARISDELAGAQPASVAAG